MKKYALYPGCIMPTEQFSYEISIREILPKFDIKLIDIEDFSCCGEPLKSVNKFLSIYLAARNIALAEKQNLDLFIPCPMCHFALSECKHILNNNPEMLNRINEKLKEENLLYENTAFLVHTLDLLHDIIGIEKIKKQVKTPLKALKCATHYGCHLIRPSDIGRPDDSENPQKMENILSALDANPEYYAEKLDCCGASLLANLPESALTKTGQKLQAIQTKQFNVMVDTCPWCHKMFDGRQQKAGETVATKLEVPVVYLTQLVGLAMGIKAEKLGLGLNMSPVETLSKT